MTEIKQKKYDIAYLKMALEWAKLSYCKRRQVGALIVKNRMIISDGYNGTPTGFENACEDENNYTKYHIFILKKVLLILLFLYWKQIYFFVFSS